MLKKAARLSLARSLKTEIPSTISWLRNKINLIHLYVMLPLTSPPNLLSACKKTKIVKGIGWESKGVCTCTTSVDAGIGQ